jgi:hypothetical protein
VRMREAVPKFYAEVESALVNQQMTGILEQLPHLEIVDRCGCDEMDCGTFHVAPSRTLSTAEQNVIGVRHGNSRPLDSVEGMVVIDTDNFGRVTTIEILNRADVAKVLQELGVPARGGRTKK